MINKEINKIAFIDFESTSPDAEKARAVQVAVFLTDLNLNIISDVIECIINPECDIPEDSIKVHGITNEMAAQAKTFAEIGPGLLGFLQGCHIAGYNVAYDIRLGQAEFARIGLHWDLSGLAIIDPLDVLRALDPRDQTSTYKKYTGKELVDAHNAKADILATHEIALAQLAKHPEVTTALDMYTITKPEEKCDLARKFVMKDGVPVFNFGPHFGEPAINRLDFLNWMLSKDFPIDTRNWVEKFIKENGG